MKKLIKDEMTMMLCVRERTVHIYMVYDRKTKG